MRTIITGGTGFLGRALARRLVEEGSSVVVVHRTGSDPARVAEVRAGGVETIAYADHVGLRGLVERSAPDVVFHLASFQAPDHTRARPDAYVEANVTLGANLLDALRDGNVRFVSAMSYFQFRGGLPAPHSLYAATKQAFSEIGRYYRELGGVDVREVVLYDNYGPGDTRNKLIPQALDAIAAGRPLEVGPSAQPVNLLHVDDVAAGMIAAAAPASPARMTVRSAEPVTVGAIIAAVEKAAGRLIRASFDESRPTNPQPLDAGDWPVPVDWAQRVSLDVGMAAIWATRSATGPRPDPTVH